jgi:hypothetical protein
MEAVEFYEPQVEGRSDAFRHHGLATTRGPNNHDPHWLFARFQTNEDIPLGTGAECLA